MIRPVPPAHILVVDDDEGLLVLMANAVQSAGHRVTTATSGRAALEALRTAPPDLMLLDLKLQDVAGSALVESLQAAKERVPFIVVTGQGDEKIAVEVMKRGALDYVMKDTALLDLLPAVVQRALAGVAQQAALAEAQRERRRLEDEIFAVTERERSKIGADLHDDLGQRLTAMELMCAGLKEDSRRDGPGLTGGLDELGRMLRESIAQTRALARGLVPVGVEPDALQMGLAELVARVNSASRVNCRFECPRPVNVADSVVAGHLYRIAQEGLNNALKHGQAKAILVDLKAEGGRLVLRVVDDGVGLARNQTSEGVGLGVMRHRAELIGAQLRIDSRPGHGVAIECSLSIDG
ncbi:MAG TPA: response regulator [Candidatus Didemnitutus sp.]|nr:response regulator [Candidatus Didemnitutus sp.]